MSDVDDTGFAGTRIVENKNIPEDTMILYSPRKTNALGEFIESEEQWGKRCGVVYGLKPLESDKLCACGHPRSAHIALLWGAHAHDGACSGRGCFCAQFRDAGGELAVSWAILERVVPKDLPSVVTWIPWKDQLSLDGFMSEFWYGPPHEEGSIASRVFVSRSAMGNNPSQIVAQAEMQLMVGFEVLKDGVQARLWQPELFARESTEIKLVPRK